MGYKVVSTAAFRRDYASITSYFSNTLKSPATAKKLVANIRNASNTLSVAPFIHAISQKRLSQNANSVNAMYADTPCFTA